MGEDKGTHNILPGKDFCIFSKQWRNYTFLGRTVHLLQCQKIQGTLQIQDFQKYQSVYLHLICQYPINNNLPKGKVEL